MKNYAIDQGNTFIKCATFLGDDLTGLKNWPLEEGSSEIAKLNDAPLIISSVSGNYDTYKSIFEDSAHKILVLDHTTSLPISNNYVSPKTLGMDRIAAVCGAKKLFPGNTCLVIDFGSCITYDFIDAQGRFFGGAISPGLNMRFKEMHQFTDGLPFVEPMGSSDFVGFNTKDSMTSGVINGIVGEIDRFMSWYTSKFENLKVLFCGGDSTRFESMIKAPIFAAPNLVLVGLNSILRHNEDSE